MAKLTSWWFPGLLAFLFALAGSLDGHAQRMAVRVYSADNGLPHNSIRSIYQDRKGYLWLGTLHGLSRFDGYRFINYDGRDGLDHDVVNSIAEDLSGRLWVGTWGSGLARLVADPLGFSSRRQPAQKKFILHPVGESRVSNEITHVLVDDKNRLWCVTGAGLYRSTGVDQETVRFELITAEKVHAAAADSKQRLWFATENDLIEASGDRSLRHRLPEDLTQGRIFSLVGSQEGRVLAASSEGVFFFSPLSRQGGSGSDGAVLEGDNLWEKLAVDLGPGQQINSMLLDSLGALWLATSRGLIRVFEGRQTSYSNGQLSLDAPPTRLYEDREGNLWIAADRGLAVKLSGENIVSFTAAEGVPDGPVVKVVEEQGGRIFAITARHGFFEIIGDRAVPVPESQSAPFANAGKRILLDRAGRWWIGTDGGLFRTSGPQLQLRRGDWMTATDGKAPIAVFQALFEDDDGSVWVSSSHDAIYRFDAKNSSTRPAQEIQLHEISSQINGAIVAMLRDRTGAVWLGSYGGLGRLDKGQMEVLRPVAGLPDTQARAFFRDRNDRLWIGLRYGGVSMTPDPGSKPPEFINYSMANGLSSNAVWAITEDDFGRVYFATSRGLHRLDPKSGSIRHFTEADGLADNAVSDCFKDSRGEIWIGTAKGLSRLTPKGETEAKSPPAVYLTRIVVSGHEFALPEGGVRAAPALELGPSQNHLVIEHVGLSLRAGENLQYQTKFEGLDSEWRPPTRQRTLNFPQLAPGYYRLLIRAIEPDGLASSEPAVLELTVLAPVWRRSWFLAIALLAMGLGIYSLHRYRVSRLLELERIRTRIATDLHDDIGSNLSRIAILSEVVRHQAGEANPGIKAPLSTIASVSRELVDSMSDIVWAINPHKDKLIDLSQRMRRFASDVLAAREIEFQFDAPPSEFAATIGADVRREVFLIFKESISNVARHSQCSQVAIRLRLDNSSLAMEIEDNGRGLAEDGALTGHGLTSMMQRAEAIGGNLEISAGEQGGTRIRLSSPLKGALSRRQLSRPRPSK